ncbi:MAG: hypothetical protein WC679_01275 [Bacteroidales bacterium]|jgi:hypothetical protein
MTIYFYNATIETEYTTTFVVPLTKSYNVSGIYPLYDKIRSQNDYLELEDYILSLQEFEEGSTSNILVTKLEVLHD